MPDKPTLNYARRKPMAWWLVSLFAIAFGVNLIAFVLPWTTPTHNAHRDIWSGV